MRLDATTTRDPLAAYMSGAVVLGTGAPMPLIDTCYEVIIDSGLAVVTTTRLFRNAEAESIEATITFPVPVRAVLFSLVARIGERTLNARAKARELARETYEEAIDSGKAAVLHEEVLKGVHKLSVGHVPPGAEVAIETKWALPLTLVGGRGHLRIPLTTGDIYGRSPLAPEDDLVTGGPQQAGKLKVMAPGGGVQLHGKRLGTDETVIPLNRPIDLTVPAWTPRAIVTEDVSGKKASLTFSPVPQGDDRLSLAILVDHSGSMGTSVSLIDDVTTCHGHLKRGLLAASDSLTAEDRVCLWEFDNTADRVGTTENWQRAGGAPRSINELFRSLVGQLADPRGGTEIGGALAAVLGNEPQVDILLVTDGQTHALDVQRLARHRRRISVILVGEDSLEANVGHLAALTGGDVFVATPEDIDQVVSTALASMRVFRGEPLRGDSCWRQAGVEIALTNPPADADTDVTLGRAGAAVLAALRMTELAEEEAARLAEAEGIVTHLTSLILVDEAGERQEGLPQTRKVALPSSGVVAWAALSLSAYPDVSRAILPNRSNYVASELISASYEDDGIDVIPYIPAPARPKPKTSSRPIVILVGGSQEKRIELALELDNDTWNVRLARDEEDLIKELKAAHKRSKVMVVLLAGCGDHWGLAEMARRMARRARVIVLDVQATEAPGTVSTVADRIYRGCGSQSAEDLEAIFGIIK